MESSEYFSKKIEEMRRKVAKIKGQQVIEGLNQLVQPVQIRKVKNAKAHEN